MSHESLQPPVVYRRGLSALRRLRSRLFVAAIYERDLRREVLKPAPEGYSARFVNRDELLNWCQDQSLKLSTAFVEAAFSRGDVCTAMFHDNRLVAYMWRSTSRVPHVKGIDVETRKPYRYGYKAYTLPEYRGRHIPEYLAPVASQFYIERGYPISIGFVETRNRASRRSEVRRGSILIGFAGYVRLPGMIWTFRTRRVRAAGFRFIAHADGPPRSRV